METTSQDPASAAPAPSAESEARAVDRILYIQTADGLGLYMRTGPGTNYSKVNSHTMPNGTALHITREITAANGWTWGWCTYQFPGKSTADSGWACLVETTTQAPTAAQSAAPAPEPAPAQQETKPAQQEEPAAPLPEEEAPPEADPVQEADTAEATADDTQNAPAKAAAQAENAGTYSSMSLVIIGVVIGVVAAAAVLLIATKRKR